MTQLVFRASEGFLAFQDEEFFHCDARKGGEGGGIGYEGEGLPVTSELVIGHVSNGIRWVEGSGPRVVFALVVAVSTTLGLLLDSTNGDGMSVVRSSGCRANGRDGKVFRPRLCSTLVVSIIIVYSRMACELVRTRETLLAAEESTAKWLLAGVSAYVASLMFKPAECSSTFWIRTFVGTGESLVLRLERGSCAHEGTEERMRGLVRK